MTDAEFSGFPVQTFSFLAELEQNNRKEWFDENRNTYETYWKAPALDLIQALAKPMAGLALPLKAEARINGSLRRINQDVRFSKDKSPYKARIHLIFWSGSHPNRSPGFHLVLHRNSIGFGAGEFGFEPARLRAVRDRISDPADRAGLLDAIAQAKVSGCEFDAPDLVKLPKGFKADGDWEHLLRRKTIVMRTLKDQVLPDWSRKIQAVDHIVGIARQLNPLLAWLAGQGGADA